MAVNTAVYKNESGVNTTTPPAVLTSTGGNIAIDAAESDRYSVELTESTTELNNPSNLTDGQEFTILIKQDSTGGRALTFGTNWLRKDGVTTAISTTADEVTILSAFVASLPNGPGTRVYYTLEHADESSGSGVAGPGSSTNTAVALWNGTGGDTLQDSTLLYASNVLSHATGGTNFTVQAGDHTSTPGDLILKGGSVTGTSTGGEVIVESGDSTAGFTGPITIRTPASVATNDDSGSISITTGAGHNSSGSDSGNITLTCGNTQQGNGGNVTITAGTCTGTSSGHSGGDVTITSGGSSSNGDSGEVNIQGGAGGTNGDGGRIFLRAGAKSSQSGASITLGTNQQTNPSDVTITAGNTTSTGVGGSITITSGSNTSNTNDTGPITISTPNSSTVGGTAMGSGAISISTGNAHLTDNAGDITLSTGNGGSTTGNGGDITLDAGNSGSSSGGVAGAIVITAGAGSGTAGNDGGTITLTTGAGASGGGAGGDLSLTCGISTSDVGGNLLIQAGRGSSSANDGVVRVARNASNRAVALEFEGGDGNELSIAAPATVTAYSMLWPTAQGAADSVLSNDGSGNLSWVPNVAYDIDASVQTTDATVTTIATVATSTDDAVYVLDVSFAGIDKTANHVYERGSRLVVLRDESSVLTIRNTNNYSTYDADDNTWATSSSVSGTNVLLRVQGDATNAVEWSVKGYLIEHS